MIRPTPTSTLFPYTTLFRSTNFRVAPVSSFPILRSPTPHAIPWNTQRSSTLHMPAYAESKSAARSEEHTSELQSHHDLVCRLLLEKKKKNTNISISTLTESL